MHGQLHVTCPQHHRRIGTLSGCHGSETGSHTNAFPMETPHHRICVKYVNDRFTTRLDFIFYFTALPTPSSVLDLFHHLLHREPSGVRILKFNVEGGAPLPEVVSGLQVYTAIFRHYEFCKHLSVTSETHVGICIAAAAGCF